MKKILSVIGISLALALLTDLLFGSYLLKFTPKKIDHTTSHNVYDHDLKKSFRANLQWSPGETYLFCSNRNSFRTFCDKMDSRPDTRLMDSRFSPGLMSLCFMIFAQIKVEGILAQVLC